MHKMLPMFLLLSLCACMQNTSAQRQINDENVYDNIRVKRGSSVYGNVFFKSATNKPLGKCLTNHSSCTETQLTLGDEIEAQYYEVDISGLDIRVSYISDKLLIAAAMVAAQEGFKYITPLEKHDAYAFNQQPKSYTDCSISTYGGFCSTSTYTDISSWSSYTLSFLAYNDYNDITNGVLEFNSINENGSLFYPLYYTAKDLEDIDDNIYQNSPNSTLNIDIQRYPDAWKTKYDVLEILLGEKVQMRQFYFKDEYVTRHTYVKDKYAQ